jgi:holliday junction DNA helicase RuvB
VTDSGDALTRAEEAELSRRRAGENDDSVVSPLADSDEREIEGALRPKRLDDFIGQGRVREQLSLLLRSALRRGRPPDHVLLSGPPGLGKTTMAMIIAAELGAPLRLTSGPAIERSGDLAAVLSTLSEGEVVFIDEIHRLARPAEEMLYLAMEDFRVDIVVGKGPGATAIPLDIAPFTLVGATTRAGLLPAPLRDRFGFTAHLDFYNPEELAVIVRRSAGRAHRGRRHRRTRHPVARHAADRQPAAAPGQGLRGGPRRRQGHQGDHPDRARTVRSG